jgi:hypothetical protein
MGFGPGGWGLSSTTVPGRQSEEIPGTDEEKQTYDHKTAEYRHKLFVHRRCSISPGLCILNEPQPAFV